MIPKQFKLLNYTWTVAMRASSVPWLDADGDRIHGECDFAARTITLDAGLDPELLWHTWKHEMFHAVLSALGRSALNADEDFVDSVGGALAQIDPCPYK